MSVGCAGLRGLLSLLDMKTILVVYESKCGQAHKIAEFVADLGRRRGFAARSLPWRRQRAWTSARTTRSAS
jgi:hypothetical protein